MSDKQSRPEGNHPTSHVEHDCEEAKPLPPTLSEDEKVLERKTVRNLDLLLVPMMCAIYLLAFLDRANIGNARVAGLQQDLGLSDHQYQTAITVTYVPYIIAELPSNLVLKRIGPKIMLPGMCLCWGIVTTLQCLVHNFSGLLVCRAFLGFCEGGLFPGIVLYLSGFYRPHELQIRIGLFFSAAALSGAFSGLLAAVIENMNGVAGLQGWRWIFLLEGLFTVIFGVFAFWALPNTPHQVRTFTLEQADWCVTRLKGAQFSSSDQISFKAVVSTFKDIHIWIMCLILFCNGTSLFGLAYFTPSIVAGMGYGRIQTQLLSVPPFACAFFVTMVSAYFADKYRQRGLTAICTTCLALIGFSVFLTTNVRNNGVRYTALCFLITGIYASAPSLISWIPNNVAAHSRRATAVAMGFVATNIGGIISSWIYPRSSAPQYEFAAQFNLSLVCVTLVLISSQLLLLTRLNRRKVTGMHDGLLEELQSLSPEEQREQLGDHHPEFRYTL